MILTKSKIYELKLIPSINFEERNNFWNLTLREYIPLYDQGEIGGRVGACLVAIGLNSIRLLEYSLCWENKNEYISTMKYLLSESVDDEKPVFIDHFLKYDSFCKFMNNIEDTITFVKRKKKVYIEYLKILEN